MIGMSQIKKRFYIGLGIGLGVGLVGILGISMYSAITINSYKEGTNKEYLEKWTQQVAVTNQTILQGQTVTNGMLTRQSVHKNIVPVGALSSIGENMVAKYTIGANMTITSDMITEQIIDKDIRETEINTIIMPTNLVEGAYVDIRILFPNGTDYVVIPELQVKQILNETIWFDLSESQRSILNSAIVDTYLNEGTKLYAIEYVDETQIQKFQDNNEELIKGQLSSLIKEELPELYTNEYEEIVNEVIDATIVDDTEEQDENTDENLAEEQDFTSDWDDEVQEDEEKDEININDENATEDKIRDEVAAEKAEIIYNFIVKYRNLVASTTTTEATYQPTTIVMNAMRANPNIVDEAIAKLSNVNRARIESLNNLAKGSTDEDEEEYEKLVEGAQTSIEKQKEQRNEIMAIE